jgi:transcriptional regulator with XRE-family HTH domain
MLNDGQCRAARAFLRMTQQQLADSAGVSVMTVKRFENGSDARMSIANKIERALTAAGVDLIDDGKPSPDGGPGVRLRR